MKKTLLVLSVVITIVAVFAGGVFFAQANAQNGGWMMGGQEAPYGPDMMGNGQYGSMMGNSQYGDMMGEAQYDNGQYGGMMGESQYGDMMGNAQYGGMMGDGQYGPDMMGGGMMGMMMNGGMMGSWNGTDGFDMMGMMAGFSGLSSAEPLTITEAETAVTDYLATLNNNDLALGEIMIFDNHAYAQIIDKSTETGAFELLVDPTTGSVFPEPGPNMMWNNEYGMMANFSNGMMGGQYGSDMMGGQYSDMMGGDGYAPDVETSVPGEQAVELAQAYLDDYLPGKTADEHANAFPGYYTLHILEDGQTVGMLSVNAYTGQVFLHHWHGDFIEMTE